MYMSTVSANIYKFMTLHIIVKQQVGDKKGTSRKSTSTYLRSVCKSGKSICRLGNNSPQLFKYQLRIS